MLIFMLPSRFPVELQDARSIQKNNGPAYERIHRSKDWIGVGKMHTTSKTILLVEDEEAIRRLFVFILRPYGFTLLEASNGMEAIRIAEEYDGPIDLLVTDLDMPKLGGA